MLLKIQAFLVLDPACLELLLTFDFLCVKLVCQGQDLINKADILSPQLL